MKHYEKIAFATIGIIRTISIMTAPFVKLLSVTTNAISKIFGVGENEEEIVTEEEIKMMVDQGKEDGTIQLLFQLLQMLFFRSVSLLVFLVLIHQKQL